MPSTKDVDDFSDDLGTYLVLRVALYRWTEPGKRKRGRPKTPWRGAVLAEMTDMCLTWGRAQHVANDRAKWRTIII